MSKEIITDPVFLALDIETCGINKSIFAIGYVLFKRKLTYDDNKSLELIECIEDGIFAFTPKKPTTEIDKDNTVTDAEIMLYNDFSIDTWDNFWNLHIEILELLSNKSNCSNELELLDTFYQYWTKLTNKYHNIKLVSDNVAFDIGYIDQRIAFLNEKINDDKCNKNRRPLNYQFRKKKWYYVSPIDTNTLECVIKMGDNGKKHLDTMLEECPFENTHDPISDCKRVAWVFTRIMAYLT
jgi:hypothetical protein